MKKFTTFETQLGESVVLTDKAKLSLYKKSQNSGYSIDILEEVYRRGHSIWNESFGGSPESFAFDRVNSFISGGFAEMLDEDLINEKRGLWDNIHAKRARIKAGSGERMRKPGSEGAPTDAALKASQNEDTDPCWKGYKQVGMKKKGGREVPNCVPVKEELKPVPSAEQIAKKFQKPEDTIEKAIKSGSKVEKEHTKSQKTAEKIAAAHVNELPNYYKKLSKAGLEENAEAHSKDFTKPSSRFIGSDELTDIYKKQTPGQIIKRVVKEAAPENKKSAGSKVKKAVATGMTVANLYTAGDVTSRAQQGIGNPMKDVVAAASTLPGTKGWTAYAADKAGQAYQYLKNKKMQEDVVDEATYKGKTVPLNKPMKGDVKKSKVYVDPDGDGKAQKVNFGDKNMTIKKDQPARKKSYCARSSGQGNLTDKTSANYWSRRAWNCEETQVDETKKVQGYQNWPGEKKKKFFQGPKDKDGKTETQKWAERKQKEREAKQIDEVWSTAPQRRSFTLGKRDAEATPEQRAKIKDVIKNMKVPGPAGETPEAREARMARNKARQMAAVGLGEEN